MKLGTVLPTAGSIQSTEHYRSKIDAEKIKKGASIPNVTPKFEAGEIRYYRCEDLYAIVTDSLEIKWFERRSDDYFYAVIRF